MEDSKTNLQNLTWILTFLGKPRELQVISNTIFAHVCVYVSMVECMCVYILREVVFASVVIRPIHHTDSAGVVEPGDGVEALGKRQ